MIVGSSELPDDPAEVRAAIAMSQEAIAITGCSIVNTMSTVIVIVFLDAVFVFDSETIYGCIFDGGYGGIMCTPIQIETDAVAKRLAYKMQH